MNLSVPERGSAELKYHCPYQYRIISNYLFVCCRIDLARCYMFPQCSQMVPILMRLSKEALSTRIVVRRARRGVAPFVWEVNRDSMAAPVYVSPEAFGSMEAAFVAGQARLGEFTSSARPRPEMAE
jgi:hypothetical protein